MEEKVVKPSRSSTPIQYAKLRIFSKLSEVGQYFLLFFSGIRDMHKNLKELEKAVGPKVRIR